MIGNWINYLIFLGIVLVGLFFYNTFPMFMVVIIVCVIPLISYILYRSNRNRINIYIEKLPESVGRENDIIFDICVDNPTFYPFGNIVVKIDVENGFYKNGKEYQISLPNGIRKKRRIKWSVASKYAGNIRICLSEMEVQDAMFLFKKEINIKDEHIVKVFTEYDMVYFDDNSFLDGEGEEEETLYQKGSDVSDIADIRSYVSGDSMQSIHWKLSARRDEMLVKEYSMPYSTKMFVCVDLHVNSEIQDEMDTVIEAFAAVCSVLIASNKAFDVGWHDKNSGEIFVRTITNAEEMTKVLYDMYYSVPTTEREEMYNVYKNVFGDSKKAIFVTNKSSENIVKGERIATYKNKAVLIRI